MSTMLYPIEEDEMRISALNSCATRVRWGAGRLDELQPGWAHRIDKDKLDMGDCVLCVVGQLTCPDEVDWSPTPFSEMIETLGFNYRRTNDVDLGFDRQPGEKIYYSDMAVLWLVEIGLRDGTHAERPRLGWWS